jgi:diguanylate cyclase (GGDEF)-like protein
LLSNDKQGDNDPNYITTTRLMKIVNSRVIILLISLLFSAIIVAQENASTKTFDKRLLKIAVSSESFPYHFVDERGEPAGIMVDYWSQWAEVQNVEVEFLVFNWVDSLKALDNGEVDFHAGMAVISERKQRYEFSAPIYQHQNHIYLTRDMERVSSVKDLLPYTIGSVQEASHIGELIEQNPLINLRIFKHRFDMFEAALNDEIVAFASVGTLEKDYEKLTELKEKFPYYQRFTYYEGGLSAAVSKENLALKRFLDEGINEISVERRKALYNKWTYTNRNTDNLTIVFPTGLPPFMALSPMGNPQGLFIDIWRLWSEVTGIDVEFMPDNMTGSVERVKSHQAEVIMAYPEAIPSKTNLQISSLVYGTQAQIFVSKRVGNISSIEGLFGKSVGLFVTAPYIDDFRLQYPQIKVLEFVSHKAMIEAAENGQIDAMISEIENMNVKLVNGNLQSSFYRLPTPVFKIDLFSLVHPDNPQLTKIISEGFNRLPIEELQKIERNWLSLPEHGYFSEQSKKLNFTSEEYAFIAKHDKYTVGMVRDWQPIEFENAQGEPDGINKDILSVIAERAGLELEFKLFDNYDNLIKAFAEQQVDIVAGLAETHDENDNFAYTVPYWDMHWGILHSRLIESKQNINHFYGKELALIKGYSLISEIRKEHPQINITVVDNVEQGLLAVQQGVVDGFVDMLPVVSKLAKRENITPLAISVVEELPVGTNRVGVDQSKPVLLSILNKGLMNLDDNKRQQIFDKWFDVKVQTGLEKRFVAKVAVQIGALIFIIILVIAIWNRKLRQEIKLRKSLEKKMKHMATHDELTGLANRMLLSQQMSTALSIHQRQDLKLAILFIDLDGFKKVNDSYGHEAGDQVLIEVAQRLKDCVRQSDTVARFGGDEFVIMVTGIHSKEESTYVAEKAIKAIGEPFNMTKGKTHIGCSIGIAVYPDDGLEQSDILNMADNLMYRVKTSGKNNFTLR